MIMSDPADHSPNDGLADLPKSELVEKFLKALSCNGKKGDARRILSETLRILSRRIPRSGPLQVVEQAVNSRRLSLFAALLASHAPGFRPESLSSLLGSPKLVGAAVRSIVASAGRRRERTMPARLAAEIYEAHADPSGPEGPIRAAEALKVRRA